MAQAFTRNGSTFTIADVFLWTLRIFSEYLIYKAPFEQVKELK